MKQEDTFLCRCVGTESRMKFAMQHDGGTHETNRFRATVNVKVNVRAKAGPTTAFFADIMRCSRPLFEGTLLVARTRATTEV